MKRHIWVYVGSISLAIFAILSQLGCSKLQDSALSGEHVAEIDPASNAAETHVEVPHVEIPTVSVTNPPSDAKAQPLDTVIAPPPGEPVAPVPDRPVGADLRDPAGAEGAGEEVRNCFGPKAISGTSPLRKEKDVPLNTIPSVAFTRDVDASTLSASTFILTGPKQTTVNGTVSYNALTHLATFKPNENLLPSTTYRATIKGGELGIKDSQGKELCQDYSWKFTTALAPDILPPEVSPGNPLCGSRDVAVNQIVSVSFNEAMNPLSISKASFIFTGPGATIVEGKGAYVAASRTATFTLAADLLPNTAYTITIKGGPEGVQDLAGNFLANPFECSFTTGARSDSAPNGVINTNPTL